MRVVRVSLKTFLVTGALGVVRLGMRRAEIAELLGDPDDVSVGSRSEARRRLPPSIWKYGDLELHFDRGADRLILLHMDEFTTPTGGTKLILDPWILQREVALEELTAQLEAEGIHHERQVRADATWHEQRVVFPSGVQLRFDVEPTPAGGRSILSSISCSMPAGEAPPVR